MPSNLRRRKEEALKLLGMIGWPPLGEMVGEVIGEPISGGNNIVYFLDIEFSTDDAAPINNPYTGEIGSLATQDTNSALSVSGGDLVLSNAFGVSAGEP